MFDDYDEEEGVFGFQPEKLDEMNDLWSDMELGEQAILCLLRAQYPIKFTMIEISDLVQDKFGHLKEHEIKIVIDRMWTKMNISEKASLN